ncbi:hypothetical protein [Treponema sp.]|uniref:hypothetical protein n=1 Tax=Treponema sp. TaxID=166 RepID=UPI0025EE2630|nr:hypothetical protein [Treponema sp.]MCR5218857.1 hypothetical protein [Treponema sp.]
MKSKRRLFKLFLFLIIAGGIFACGWMQLFIEPESCSVMTSRTSGIYDKIIKNGSFNWRWEHLIPMNVKLTDFYTAGESLTCKTEGSLPQSDLYSKQVPDNPDFSYSFEYRISIRAEEEQILELYKKNIITDQDSLDSYLKVKAQALADRLTDKIINENTDSDFNLSIYTEEKLTGLISLDSEDFKYVTLDSVNLLSCKMPDTGLYNRLRDSYFKFTTEIDSVLKSKAESYAHNVFEDKRVLERLENFVILMEKYPSLKDISKTSDISQIMKVLGELK